MENYSNELLASRISDMITFEDCEYHTFNEVLIEFENCGVIFSGHADSYERRNGDFALYNIDLSEIKIYFETGNPVIMNGDEVKNIESLVELWN